jgi:hypothetical protein
MAAGQAEMIAKTLLNCPKHPYQVFHKGSMCPECAVDMEKSTTFKTIAMLVGFAMVLGIVWFVVSIGSGFVYQQPITWDPSNWPIGARSVAAVVIVVWSARAVARLTR